MEKINIAKLLKDCPKGMELDCTMFDNCTFDGVEDIGYINIWVKTPNGHIKLSKEGCFAHNCASAKCVIFPKGKTTWEGFHRPFKDGDVIFTHANCLKVGLGNTWISIFQEKRNGGVATYVDVSEDGEDYYDYIDGDKALLCMNEDIMRQRLATEEEKQKLFDAIKANGYRWNAETKTLEKLLKFKVGDKIRDKESGLHCTLGEYAEGISAYRTNIGLALTSKELEQWELAPNKFDINTLIPFDSKVLIRNDESQRWLPAFWGYKVVDGFITTFGWCKYCIPYEGNEFLFKTNNDCDDFYKTWEK